MTSVRLKKFQEKKRKKRSQEEETKLDFYFFRGQDYR